MKPFDSTSPRFNYEKFEEIQKKSPAPGQYTMHYEHQEALKKQELKRSGSINKKYISAIGSESKEKFSLFGKIVKTGQETQLGPGSYDVHALNGVASKKVFNASLQKPSPRLLNNQSGLGQSSMSSNYKQSPRSSLTHGLDHNK